MDLRTFARADDETLRPLQLDEVVGVSCRLAAPMVRHRAELVLDLASVPAVLGNRGRLGQVVTNLLVNAAQAVPEGSALTEVVMVSTYASGNDVVLAVEDSGPGVPPALRDKIFEPFFTTKPEGIGTGLGLSLVAEIVAAHQGTIRVSSGARGGARFELSFPAAQGIAVESPPPAAPEAVARARVLLVDDEAMIVRLLTTLLAQSCDVVTANGGAEAVALLERDSDFDIVLCDLHMHEVDGIDVHRALQRLRPELVDRFVFTTGGAVTARGREFLDSVEPRVLPKPFRVEELLALIQEIAARARR
jgi:CheY-like chemotaxis protein